MDVARLVPAPGVTRRLAREPAVHLLALGAALFFVHRAVAPPNGTRRIVVSSAVLDGLRQDHRRRTGVLPTPVEEAALAARWVDDEVLYREALALGLERGDVVVRRRLVQKMAYLVEDLDPIPAPGDAELAAYLAAHPERYAKPARVSLTHVFAGNDRHGEGAAAIAAAWRPALEDGAAPGGLGDPFLRGRELTLWTESELAGAFGAPFAARVMALPVGAWSEPVSSPFGWHVVRVNERRPGRAPDLADVRDEVTHDWREERRDASNRAARERLRQRYAVEVEGRE